MGLLYDRWAKKANGMVTENIFDFFYVSRETYGGTIIVKVL